VSQKLSAPVKLGLDASDGNHPENQKLTKVYSVTDVEPDFQSAVGEWIIPCLIIQISVINNQTPFSDFSWVAGLGNSKCLSTE
jgi:hypothetical protein